MCNVMCRSLGRRDKQLSNMVTEALFVMVVAFWSELKNVRKNGYGLFTGLSILQTEPEVNEYVNVSKTCFIYICTSENTHSHPLGGGHSTFLLFNGKKHVMGHVALGGE